MPTWVEITSIEHGHGGPGWELGACLWSPTHNRQGADRYGLMREPVPGDEVLQLVMARWPDGETDRRLVGRSVVAQQCATVAIEPPPLGIGRAFPTTTGSTSRTTPSSRPCLRSISSLWPTPISFSPNVRPPAIPSRDTP